LPSRSAQIKPTSRSGWVAFLTVASVLGAILRLDESLLPKEANWVHVKKVMDQAALHSDRRSQKS
jgi:hypothetical protein